MESVLIMGKTGVAFAGKLIHHDPKSEWMGIKPSEKSAVTVYYNRLYIQSVLHQNGYEEVFSQEKTSPAYDVEPAFFGGETVLVRVNGGVSYRGCVAEAVADVDGSTDGYWISPSPGNGIVIHVPEKEVEEVFGL